MLPLVYRHRLASLTDDLLQEDDLEAAFLAALLFRATQALADGSIVWLGTRVWRDRPEPLCEPARR